MKKNLLQLIIFLLIHLLVIKSQEIAILADIHLDLLYDSNSKDLSEKTYCKNMKILNPFLDPRDLGKYLCNTNLNLLNSAINRIKSIQPDPKVIIIGGDSVAHYLMELNLNKQNKEFFIKTIRTIYEKVYNSFPNALILPVFGNNDLISGYNPPLKKHKEEYYFWYNLYFPNKLIDKATFTDGGYYFVKHFNDQLVFIVLNSLYFTKLSSKRDDLSAYTQLFWLNKTLSALNDTSKAVILSHIGPFPQFFSNHTNFYWYDDYLEVFDQIIKDNKQKVILNLNFHKHFSNFAVIHNFSTKENYLPTLLLPSISPYRETNPAFTIISYNTNISKINDVRTFHLDLNENKWGISYSLKDDFGFESFDSLEFFLLGKFLVFPWRMRRYVTYRIGYGKRDYKEALLKLKELGNLDNSTNLEHLRCNMINIYERYYNRCIYDLQNSLYKDF